jgi:hypothetical protein
MVFSLSSPLEWTMKKVNEEDAYTAELSSPILNSVKKFTLYIFIDPRLL